MIGSSGSKSYRNSFVRSFSIRLIRRGDAASYERAFKRIPIAALSSRRVGGVAGSDRPNFTSRWQGLGGCRKGGASEPVEMRCHSERSEESLYL
jgi:hypothetical protein